MISKLSPDALASVVGGVSGSTLEKLKKLGIFSATTLGALALVNYFSNSGDKNTANLRPYGLSEEEWEKFSQEDEIDAQVKEWMKTPYKPKPPDKPGVSKKPTRKKVTFNPIVEGIECEIEEGAKMNKIPR